MRIAYFEGFIWDILEAVDSKGNPIDYAMYSVKIHFPDDHTRLDVWDDMLLIDGVLRKLSVKEGVFTWPCHDALSEVTISELSHSQVEDHFAPYYGLYTCDFVDIIDSHTLRVTRDFFRSNNPEMYGIRIRKEGVCRMPDDYSPKDNPCTYLPIPDVEGLDDTDYPIYVSEYSSEVLIIMKSGLAIIGTLFAWGENPRIELIDTLKVECSDFQGAWFVMYYAYWAVMILNGGVLTEYELGEREEITSRVVWSEGFITRTWFKPVCMTKRIKSAMEE